MIASPELAEAVLVREWLRTIEELAAGVGSNWVPLICGNWVERGA